MLDVNAEVPDVDDDVGLPMFVGRVEEDSRASSVEPAAIRVPARRPIVSSDSRDSISVDLSTRGFEDSMRAGQANMLVAVRTRPISAREKAAGAREVIKILDGQVVVLMDTESSPGDFLRKSRSRERRYAFDHAFDESCDQRHVYDHTTKFLIQGISNGYNASVFAYGATGAGKTHTMTGTHSQPGIMALALEDLFAYVGNQDDHSFKVTLSFLEVYNENLRDLLKPSSNHLNLREDPVKGIVVSGVTELVAQSAKEVMELLSVGNQNRTTEPTAANQTSSRSHAILQIVVEKKNRTADKVESVRIGKLSLIDLAGSERASLTQNRGLRMIEGANINRSLLALGNCINALGSKSNFVPFRDSKLTRMLKDSLGGNTRTVMITNISKADMSFEDTHNTLKYANRAKNIKTTVRRNVLEVSHHLAQYTEIINDLRREVADLKRQVRRRQSQDLSHTLRQEHWLSTSEMTTWNDTRRKAQSIFIERRQLLERASSLQIENLANEQQLKKAELLARTCESPTVQTEHDRRVKGLHKKAMQKSQQELQLKKLNEQIMNKEKRLREVVGIAGVNASQSISQILDLELDRHELRIQNLHLSKQNVVKDHSIRSDHERLKELEEQIRYRDTVIKEQSRVLQEHNIELEHPDCRRNMFSIDDILSCSPSAPGWDSSILSLPAIPETASIPAKPTPSASATARRQRRTPNQLQGVASQRKLKMLPALQAESDTKRPRKPATLCKSVLKAGVLRLKEKVKMAGSRGTANRKLKRPSRFGFAATPLDVTPGRASGSRSSLYGRVTSTTNRKSVNEHRQQPSAARMPRSKRLAKESRDSRIDEKQGELHSKERKIADIQVELIDDAGDKSIPAPDESERSTTPAPSLSSQDSLLAQPSED